MIGIIIMIQKQCFAIKFLSLYRATILLPSGWPFIVVCAALRFVEGTGVALFSTGASYLLIQLYPDSVGLVMVIIFMIFITCMTCLWLAVENVIIIIEVCFQLEIFLL